MSTGKLGVRNTFFFAMLAAFVFVSGLTFGGCEKKKEAVYTIGPENVPDLEKGEQEVKGEKAVNPLEATKEDESGEGEDARGKSGGK